MASGSGTSFVDIHMFDWVNVRRDEFSVKLSSKGQQKKNQLTDR